VRAVVLIDRTAPVAPAQLARQARADTYAPDFHFVDPEIIAQVHARGLRIVPWTVNEPRDWTRLVAWGVDGLTTDHPDILGEWLRKQRIDIL
jgi:glycerophosphoryl diester phosphodiesterase